MLSQPIVESPTVIVLVCGSYTSPPNTTASSLVGSLSGFGHTGVDSGAPATGVYRNVYVVIGVRLPSRSVGPTQNGFVRCTSSTMSMKSEEPAGVDTESVMRMSSKLTGTPSPGRVT